MIDFPVLNYYFDIWDFQGARHVKRNLKIRGGSRITTTSKVELFVIIVNGFQPLTITTKSSTLDVAAVLDPPLKIKNKINVQNRS